MPTDPAYEAFISYSHADQRSAVWLQRALERFRIPQRLVAELQLDRNRFLPMFRDEDELASSPSLPDVLQRALAASRNLIVVCSPAAARSEWVNAEVSSFQALGRGERIFCLLVAGDPADPASCLPPALRDSIPLAIDARPGGNGRSAATMRLAASLLGIRYDQLRQRALQARRRRLIAQSSGLLAGVVAVTLTTYQLTVTRPCETSDLRLAQVWNSETRNTIEQSFLATGLPYASAALDNVFSRLAAYHDNWVSMHREACVATMVRNEQSPQLMDLRMACLDQRRDEFAGLVQLLQNADEPVVESAVASAGRLRTLSRCADRVQLEAAFPLPEDPAARAAVAGMRANVAATATEVAAGRLDPLQNRVDILVGQAAALNYPALEAETLLMKSRLQMAAGQFSAAKDTVYAAASAAVRARDNELVARVWLSLPTALVKTHGDIEQAFQLLELARAYIAQLPPDHPLEADFHGARGDALLRGGKLLEGVEDMRTAARISADGNLPEQATHLTRLAWGLSRLHEMEEALTVATQARALAARDFGTAHPIYATTLKDLSRVHSQRGEREEALALQLEAVTIEETVYPTATPVLANSVERLGWTYGQVGRYEEAITQLRRAIAMERAFDDPSWGNIAAAYNDLGDVYISLGDYEAARTELESALAVWREQGQVVSIGIALGNLGNTSNRARRFDEAADYCQQGLDNDRAYLTPAHPDLAYPLTCLGEARLGKGNAAAALEPLAEAHELRNRIDVDAVLLAWTRWLYGRALWESQQDTDLGMKYVQFAADTLAQQGDATVTEFRDVQSWLQKHSLDSVAPR